MLHYLMNTLLVHEDGNQLLIFEVYESGSHVSLDFLDIRTTSNMRNRVHIHDKHSETICF